MNIEQMAKIRDQEGFIAALDQSGGGTPKTKQAYGVGGGGYEKESEKF